MKLIPILFIILLILILGCILSLGLRNSVESNPILLPGNPATLRFGKGEDCGCGGGAECITLAAMNAMKSDAMNTSTDTSINQDDCGEDHDSKKGGRESEITTEIVERLFPYIKQAGDKHLIEYLLAYLDYSPSRAKSIKKEARVLRALIQDIVDSYNISSLEDFLFKTHLTFGSFLPETHRCLLDTALLNAKISDSDRKLAQKQLDYYLGLEEVYLTKTRLMAHLDEFLQAERLFKLKADKIKAPIDKLKKLAKTSPSKVFELDLLGMRVAMQYFAHKISMPTRDKDLIARLKRDIVQLKLLRDYPDVYIDDVYTIDELSRRLARAADRLRPGRRPYIYTGVSPILSDIAREKAELDKYSAQREAKLAQERAKTESARAQAERERAERAERERATEKVKALEERKKREMLEIQAAERFRDEEQRRLEHRAAADVPDAPAALDEPEPPITPDNPPPGVDKEWWKESLKTIPLQELIDITQGKGEEEARHAVKQYIGSNELEDLDNILNDPALEY